MGAIFDTMVRFFRSDDWNFTQLQNEPILSMGVSGKNGKWRCFAKAREEQYQFVFYSVLETNTPENKRAAIAEFLTRANFGLVIGNFEMDYSDGEIRYKTSLDTEGDQLSDALIKNAVYTNIVMMDRYLPGIMAVIYGNASAFDAIRQVEG
ncbi:MAG: YbjN domain-containing protein [Chloroflexi bacterium]|nr:YbjN domain-containing protein [Chloroflexota bacterium]